MTIPIRELIAKANKELVEEIIENIPLCRDSISKCDCRDHDINTEAFLYLEEVRERVGKSL